MENPIKMDDLGIPLFLETPISHRIHVWYIYLHLVDFYGKYIGKYTSPMDPMGSGGAMISSHSLLNDGRQKQVIPLCEF